MVSDTRGAPGPLVHSRNSNTEKMNSDTNQTSTNSSSSINSSNMSEQLEDVEMCSTTDSAVSVECSADTKSVSDSVSDEDCAMRPAGQRTIARKLGDIVSITGVFTDMHEASFGKELGILMQLEEAEGLFTFQSSGTDPAGTLILARIDDVGGSVYTRANEDGLKEATGSRSVRIIEWLGCSYVQIHYSEWNLIPAVLTCVLRDYAICGHPHFRCTLEQGSEFTRETWERAMIEYIDECIQYATFGSVGSQSLTLRSVMQYYPRFDVALNPLNWLTMSGMSHCFKLRDRLGLSDKDRASPYRLNRHALPGYLDALLRHNVYGGASWSQSFIVEAHEFKTALESGTVTLRCVACGNAEAEREALPCGHIRICATCGNGTAAGVQTFYCPLCEKRVRGSDADDRDGHATDR